MYNAIISNYLEQIPHVLIGLTVLLLYVVQNPIICLRLCPAGCNQGCDHDLLGQAHGQHLIHSGKILRPATHGVSNVREGSLSTACFYHKTL